MSALTQLLTASQHSEVKFDSRHPGATPPPGGHQVETCASERSLRLLSPRKLLSLPVLVAFGLFSSPARAMPAASMQLFRLDGHGMKPLPALSTGLSSPAQTPTAMAAATLSRSNSPTSMGNGSSPSRTTSTLIAVADGSLSDPRVLEVKTDGTVQINSQADKLTAALDRSTLTIRFNLPIPTDIQGPIIVRFLNSDNTLGTVQQEITSYTISPDGLRVTLKPSANLPAGQNFIFEFPGTCSQGPCIYPGQPATQPLYIGFNSSQLIGPVLAGSFPVLAVVLGVVVVGLGVAAASGAFSNGGGGNNPSSQ